MRVAAISYGTEGDVRPMVALGTALRERGHEFVLAADAGTAPVAAPHGIDFVPLSGDIRSRLTGSDEMGEFVRRGDAAVAGIGPVRHLLAEHLHRWTLDFLEAAGAADVVLTSGLSLPAGFNAAERLGVPAVATFFQPFEPSRHQKSSMLPPRIPLRLHAPLFRLGSQASWRVVRHVVNDSRRSLGLEPRVLLWRRYQQLCAWSPTLAPPPPDWGPEVCVTGDWRLPAHDDFQPDPALADFLAAGDSPVYVGFGSMSVPDGMVRAIIDGLDGRRALLAPGWSGDVPRGLPSTVHVVGHTPHDWLFQHVSAAVHH
ncbi:glycosyltransferase [Luteococcus sp. Sow4_B9]|uniref:glycosyltransferase n=1 Tax=Luteococcus sp. Sow4_B9 TaxID=3438792 RepID=UPI003F98CBBC